MRPEPNLHCSRLLPRENIQCPQGHAVAVHCSGSELIRQHDDSHHFGAIQIHPALVTGYRPTVSERRIPSSMMTIAPSPYPVSS